MYKPGKDEQEQGLLTVRYDVDRKGEDSELQVLDGYFVHFFSPSMARAGRLTRHAVFVLDVSGSMSGQRISQLKDAMFTVLDEMVTNTDLVISSNCCKRRQTGIISPSLSSAAVQLPGDCTKRR